MSPDIVITTKHWQLAMGFVCGVLITYTVFSSSNGQDRTITKQVSMPLPILETRDKLGKLLTRENFTSGVEVGVQRGHFSQTLLNNWPTCRELHLIDVWEQQKSYDDASNVPNDIQQKFLLETKDRLKKFNHILHYHRNYSDYAVSELKDNSLDFVYLDARHDYVGVSTDLKNFWPKLKIGGILAGHDYLDVSEAQALHGDKNSVWATDASGAIRTDNKAVKSAVNEFAEKHQRQVLVTTKEQWPTWYLRK